MSMGIISHPETYPNLLPRNKYCRAFCTEEEIQIAEQIKEFVDKEMMPRRHDFEGGWHRDENKALETCYSTYAKLWKLGVMKAAIPTKYGGLGLSTICRAMINEEISRADISIGSTIGRAHWAMGIIHAGGREDLLEEFAPVLAGDDPWFLCVWMTEPHGGANVEDPAFEGKYIRTIAKRDGDDWILNGHKVWPSPSHISPDHFKTQWTKGLLLNIVVATEDPSRGLDGIGLFVVPPDAKGLTISKPFEKHGMCYGEENCEQWLDNVRIPKKYRIDTEIGQGGKIFKSYCVSLAKLSTSPRLCGAAQACLEIALDWTATREIAGKPVREHSLFAGIFAECFRLLDSARNYYLSVMWQTSHPEIYGRAWNKELIGKCAAARCTCGDAAEYIISRTMELMGAYGYSYDYHIEKYMRDFRIARMWIGGRQRDLLDIAQGLYGIFKWPGQEEWERKTNI